MLCQLVPISLFNKNAPNIFTHTNNCFSSSQWLTSGQDLATFEAPPKDKHFFIGVLVLSRFSSLLSGLKHQPMKCLKAVKKETSLMFNHFFNIA